MNQMKRESTPRVPSALDIYRSELKRFPQLSGEEEQRLARACRGAGGAHIDRLVTANLRFVVKVAYEYRSCGLSMADLIQEGNIGLIKAAQRYDPDRNARLVSYAAPWIHARIQAHILRSFSLVKLGTTQAQRKLYYSLARTRRELDGQGGMRGSESDGEDAARIAKMLNVKPAEVREMSQRLVGRDLSLDASLGEDGSPTHLDLLVDERPAQDEELSAAQERTRLQGSVREALARLDRRERYIVEQRVMNDVPVSLNDIGGYFRVSPERARQLEIRARRKLQRELDLLAAERRQAG
jgi:RNA polymerase sigma-32 factor